jgi:hypothetical protein
MVSYCLVLPDLVGELVRCSFCLMTGALFLRPIAQKERGQTNSGHRRSAPSPAKRNMRKGCGVELRQRFALAALHIALLPVHAGPRMRPPEALGPPRMILPSFLVLAEVDRLLQRSQFHTGLRSYQARLQNGLLCPLAQQTDRVAVPPKGSALLAGVAA